jgi:uncharacterized protein (DUF427 family)
MTTSVAPREDSDSAPPTTAPSRGELRIDRTAKRIRVVLAGEIVADSVRANLAYATGRHPEYLLPEEDIEWGTVDVEDATPDSDLIGLHNPLRSRNHEGTIGRRYVDGSAAGLVSFEFDKMDAWFEEDEQIWFHPRDPYRRVEVIESSRSIEVTVDGRLLADSERPRLVTETGLPERWYIPRVDVDWTQLAPSTTSSGCQYKGEANWWHVDADGGDRLADVVWGYERPIPEASKLAGLVAFYAEHAAVETYIDGVRQPKPRLDTGALNPSLGLKNLAA